MQNDTSVDINVSSRSLQWKEMDVGRLSDAYYNLVSNNTVCWSVGRFITSAARNI